MTIKEFRKLAHGTKVAWREGANSSRAGEVTVTGAVVRIDNAPGPLDRWIIWQDGQRTDGRDDWALRQVELETRVVA